ncbi:MAG TPA: ATP-dependent RNA helicase HrpA [Acidimicrobiales bacterium]|nr:ATP-dependent RNA helicase HrpA [Acidimicrobiales bacterium]
MTGKRPNAVGTSRALARAEARAGARSGLAPLRYPEDLPISAAKDEVVGVLKANQVLVVAGETGSGKSTQLPKMCLEAGRGSAGVIGHTQPRRIAARSIAERVAEELGSPLGTAVGYKVRFTDRVSDSTLVKVMTDGVLLAELHNDRALRAYDTLIIDEAHERSLNIDFILGYLKRLLPSRPDLSVVITSATIDTARFAEHFWGAPVIEVSGRTYPVEIRYQPFGSSEEPEDDEGLLVPDASASPAPGPASAPVADGTREPVGAGEEVDEVQAVVNAVAELSTEGPGDILVFLAGEREVRDTAEALTRSSSTFEVLPLFGRLSSAEQHRIFEPHTGRRVVLATNVAETSLTVPGIRYVVDVGTARISRYSRRTKVQRLPIEPVSQASANQRAGRCGRLGPGICVRLYSEADFSARRPFTEPEILRTNLASVVLQMAAIGLGEAEDFPFIDPPDRRNIRDGVAVLEEIGALTTPSGGAREPQPGAVGPRALTPVGRSLARLPVDPRYGRVVIEAARLGCLDDALVVVSALSVQDPRERPVDKREAAAALHARFEDPGSDFVSYLNLWAYLEERQQELSSSQFRRMCRRELISYQRAREWQDVHSQLREIAVELAGGPAWRRTEGPERASVQRDRLHRAVLAGLVAQVGVREGERADFLGPRGARFALWPGSALAKKPPRWVMAAELVETGRLWGRVVAAARPQWVEEVASHLLKWSYSEAVWDPARGEAVVIARAALYGLPVVVGRRIGLARLDPQTAREMFITEGLAEGDWEGAPQFVSGNLAVLSGARSLLERARRPELAAGNGTLVDFYARRIGEEVVSAHTFNAWWRLQGPRERALLEAGPEDLLPAGATELGSFDFPDAWSFSGQKPLLLRYKWEPGEPDDGVIVEVPLAELPRLGQERLEWQVPGLRLELVTALVRSLPKDLRRHLVPVPGHAQDFLAKYAPADGPLLPLLARALSEAAATPVSPRDFDWAKVPAHLTPTFSVVGEQGRVLATGKQVDALLSRLEPQLQQALQVAASSAQVAWGPPGRQAAAWDFGEVPEVFEADWQGYRVRGYPTLVDEDDRVAVHVLPDPGAARRAMLSGVRRLVLLNLPSRRQLVDQLERLVDNRTKLALVAVGSWSYLSARELVEDVVTAAVDQQIFALGAPPRSREAFEVLVGAVRSDLGTEARKGLRAAAAIISRAAELDKRSSSLRAKFGTNVQASLDDVASQLAMLSRRFVASRAGLARLPDIERYLTALERRLDRLPAEARRDAALASRAREIARALGEAVAQARAEQLPPGVVSQLEDLSWLVEELRVSFFAQSLGTKVPVSEERIQRAVNQLLSGPRSAPAPGSGS